MQYNVLLHYYYRIINRVERNQHNTKNQDTMNINTCSYYGRFFEPGNTCTSLPLCPSRACHVVFLRDVSNESKEGLIVNSVPLHNHKISPSFTLHIKKVISLPFSFPLTRLLKPNTTVTLKHMLLPFLPIFII